jgi:hypothetical protein
LHWYIIVIFTCGAEWWQIAAEEWCPLSENPNSNSVGGQTLEWKWDSEKVCGGGQQVKVQPAVVMWVPIGGGLLQSRQSSPWQQWTYCRLITWRESSIFHKESWSHVTHHHPNEQKVWIKKLPIQLELLVPISSIPVTKLAPLPGIPTWAGH